MDKIIFEIISVLSCVFFNRDLDLPRQAALLLVITIALRIIWNSAIVIHGLGHALAIAAIDRQLVALKISNILEHRDGKNYSEVVVAFSSNFYSWIKFTSER